MGPLLVSDHARRAPAVGPADGGRHPHHGGELRLGVGVSAVAEVFRFEPVEVGVAVDRFGAGPGGHGPVGEHGVVRGLGTAARVVRLWGSFFNNSSSDFFCRMFSSSFSTSFTTRRQSQLLPFIQGQVHFCIPKMVKPFSSTLNMLMSSLSN